MKSRIADFSIFIAVDIETTGLSLTDDRITEVAAVRFCNGKKTDVFRTYVDPEKDIPEEIVNLTGITNEIVKDAPKVRTVLDDLKSFCGSEILIAHNAPFDLGFIDINMQKYHLKWDYNVIDTLKLTRSLYPNEKHSLIEMAHKHGVELEKWHTAEADATATGYLFIKILEGTERDKLKFEYFNNILYP